MLTSWGANNRRGLRMGQVIGETDSRATRAKSGTISFQNILATIYHVLGVDPSLQLTDFNGRGRSICSTTGSRSRS
jgi:hypothetical protein